MGFAQIRLRPFDLCCPLWRSPSMMTNERRCAPFRRRECAKDRRQRHLRSEARLGLHLCRDAARIPAHRGGHDSRVNTIHTSTQTDIEYVASDPVAAYVAGAPVIADFLEPRVPVIEPAPVLKHVSFPPDEIYAAPAPVAPSPVISTSSS